MIKSIRTKLTFWYSLVLLMLLACFCLLLYFSIHHALNRQVNSLLMHRAHAIADGYVAETDSYQDLPPHDFQTEPLLWLRLVRQDGSLWRPAPSFQIFNHPFTFEAAKSLSVESPLIETFSLSDGQQFRSVIFPLDVGLKRFGWIQFVKPISDLKETLRLVRLYMLVLVPFTVFILAGAGSFLARRSMRPVEEIRRQVSQIYDKNLSQRIKIINPHDELGLLTQTFNQMLERLQAAFASQRRFLADASHELKTPITILRSQWEKMCEAKSIPRNLKQQLQADIEELTRLAKLVDNLLLLSAIDDNQIRIEQKPVDLAEILKEVFEDGKILAAAKKHQINFECRDAAIILGDRNRLIQLFLNLVDNAVKYTDKGGQISLVLSKSADNVHVQVTDSGAGIPEEELPLLFERFYRVDKSRSRQLGGSGLGLSICQWIVSAHGGQIDFQSKLNHGTTVSIQFPMM